MVSIEQSWMLQILVEASTLSSAVKCYNEQIVLEGTGAQLKKAFKYHHV